MSGQRASQAGRVTGVAYRAAFARHVTTSWR